MGIGSAKIPDKSIHMEKKFLLRYPNLSVVAALVLSSWLLIGCGGKTDESDTKMPAPKPKPKPTAPAEQAASAPDAPAPPTAATTPAPETAPAAADDLNEDQKARLNYLSIALDQFRNVYMRFPKNMDELAKSGYITQMPKPPGGKKFAIDEAHFRVILVDK